MRIGFYAPLKAPDHPVPSGDRQMARLLVAALQTAGHAVEVVSTLRSFLSTPDAVRDVTILDEAAAEVRRLTTLWRNGGRRPDLVFAYHLHYKAPDLVGLPLARLFGMPYVTAEASYGRKRDAGPWAVRQDRVVEAVRAARLNLCFTANDRSGLAEIVDATRLADLHPFIDAAPFAQAPYARAAGRDLVVVAMMRSGDKLASYRFLAAALARIDDLAWRLTIVGDGPARAEVEQAFAAWPADRVRFLGQLAADGVRAALRAADLFVWPGFNEAYGLCYLEAGATGLPAVAIQGEGTPSVIRDGQTGLLTSADTAAYADAIARLLADDPTRGAYGQAARRFVLEERSLPPAAARLDAHLRAACRTPAPPLPTEAARG